MLDGKKGVAQKIVYGAFATVEEKTGKPALEVFEEAMNNVMPALEVKARLPRPIPPLNDAFPQGLPSAAVYHPQTH